VRSKGDGRAPQAAHTARKRPRMQGAKHDEGANRRRRSGDGRLSDKLGKVLSRSVIVENRPGGGTVIGAAAVASSSPDGYTLLLVSPAHTINPHINKTLRFNPLTDFTPIAQLTRSAYVLVTAAKSSITSVRDLMTGPQRKDVQFSYASSGTGSAPHLAGQLLASLGGAAATHVPYPGGSPAMVRIVRGDVDVYFSSISGARSFIESNQVRALAVSSDFRVRAFPDIPTVGRRLRGERLVRRDRALGAPTRSRGQAGGRHP
jgi:tripartite-type tricarboxylate transporter receptor subunit TctC